jgi:opacity protein-like surface antigen
MTVPARHRSTGQRLALLLVPTLVLHASAAHADPSSTSPEQGYDLGEVQSPRAVGMGGAQTALGTSTTALWLNPANLPVARVYHFEALAAISPDARRQSYGGAVVDSSTSKLAGGFGGTWSMLDPDGIRRSWTDFRLALAYPLSDKISLGMTGRYLRASQAISTGPLGASTASGGTAGDPMFNSFTFDAGVAVTPLKGLQVGMVGHNLTNPGTSLAPTTLVGGVGFTSSIFSIEGDAMADFTTWKSTRGRYMLGGEVFVADHFPLRLGYRYDDGQKAHAISAGAGYVDRKWSFELSARRDVVADHPMTIMVAGLRYFYESAGSEGGEATGMDSSF